MIVALALPATAAPIAGSPGMVAAAAGVTLLDVVDATLAPTVFTALTVNV